MILAKINTDFWYEDDFIELKKQSKLLYFYLMTSPFRKYTSVCKWKLNFACYYTGLTKEEIEGALKELVGIQYIDVYNGYIGITTNHVESIGGPYGAINVKREKEKFPDTVLKHFFPKDYAAKMKVEEKPGPKSETIKEVIAKQNKLIQPALTDFVADRIERKRPPTSRAVKGWISKLEKMYPNNYAKQIESVEQSIMKSWSGLFEVQDDSNNDKKFM